MNSGDAFEQSMGPTLDALAKRYEEKRLKFSEGLAEVLEAMEHEENWETPQVVLSQTQYEILTGIFPELLPPEDEDE